MIVPVPKEKGLAALSGLTIVGAPPDTAVFRLSTDKRVLAAYHPIGTGSKGSKAKSQ